MSEGQLPLLVVEPVAVRREVGVVALVVVQLEVEYCQLSLDVY